MEKIKLTRPLKVNGTDLSEVTADFDAITTQDFMRASGRASAIASSAGGVMLGTEFDAGFHLALAQVAVTHGTKGVTLMDIERVTGRDLLTLQRAGRNFCLSGLSED